MVVARSEDDAEEENSSNNSNNKNKKLPNPDKMIQQRTHVEFTLSTVREVLSKWDEVPMDSKAQAEVCEDIRLRMNEKTVLNTFWVMVVCDTGLGSWPLPFLEVKGSFVSLQMT